jgi:hypothetical protein
MVSGTTWAASDEEWLSPQACLEHRHSFVRRNAVLAINALYKLPKGELLLQDAPELIEKVLQVRRLLHRVRDCFGLWIQCTNQCTEALRWNTL